VVYYEAGELTVCCVVVHFEAGEIYCLLGSGSFCSW